MDLHKVDFNLLKLLDALLKESSVTRAGERIGLSQPAASRGLTKLRNILNDRILVRTTKGWELTPRAQSLEGSVAKILEDVKNIITPNKFDPLTYSNTFTIATADHLAAIMLPKLVKSLAVSAPNINLSVPVSSGDNVDLIAMGSAELALGHFPSLPGSFYSRALYNDDFVCIVRRNHPVLKNAMTLEQFASLSHVSITISGHGVSDLDHTLSQLGLSRRIAVRTPHFLVAPNIVAESDLALTIPRRLAEHISKSLAVKSFELPIEIKDFSPVMIWHEKFHHDEAHKWLRTEVFKIAQLI